MAVLFEIAVLLSFVSTTVSYNILFHRKLDFENVSSCVLLLFVLQKCNFKRTAQFRLDFVQKQNCSKIINMYSVLEKLGMCLRGIAQFFCRLLYNIMNL